MLALRYRCPLAWEELAPGERPTERWCATCGRTVTDLSALTREEAGSLLASPERTCGRLRLERGEPVFAPARALAAVAIPALLAAGPALAEEPAKAPEPVSTPAPSDPAAPPDPPTAPEPEPPTYRFETVIMGEFVPVDPWDLAPPPYVRHIRLPDMLPVPWKPPDPETP